MPEEYRNPDDTVAAYRAYYAGEKAEWAEWRYTDEPSWLEGIWNSSETALRENRQNATDTDVTPVPKVQTTVRARPDRNTVVGLQPSPVST